MTKVNKLLSYLCGSACGLWINYGSVSSLGGEGGEWSTVSVNLQKDTNRNNHNYINVSHFFILTMKFAVT